MTENRNNYRLSKEFIAKLAEISAGYLQPELFDKLLALFESEISKIYFTRSAESNLLRLITGMFDKVTFLGECLKYPHYAELIISLSANSNYLCDILVRDPEYFYWIVNPSTLGLKLDAARFTARLKEALAYYKSFGAKLNALRSLKRKEILRIGAKDIFSKVGLKEITAELSVLASAVASELFAICYAEIISKYKIPALGDKYCLAALGKLGGNELNYSSDIDLIIFYDENITLPGGKEYYEILNEAVLLFIESATAVTGNGYIYRVDFRLRPDGRNSPLCRSLNEYLNYYETRGEDWERQMLIKLDFVAGSRSLYDSLAGYLKPFIYPMSFSSSPTEQIRRLKHNIEKNLKDEDIKLLPGGIRDIEFSVQALQLLNGGKNKNIRTGNTLEALDKLSAAGLLNKEETRIFREAYALYRKIEHYLQLMNDAQTHVIPSAGETLDKLSCFLGYSSPAAFKNSVASYRKKVQKVFNSILGSDDSKTGKAKSFETIKFKNEKKAHSDLAYLREGKGLLGSKQFDMKSISAFQALEDELNNFLAAASDPDTVLQNFVRIIRNANLPSIWYGEFSNKKLFASFLTVCGYSQKTVDLFAEDVELREYFLTRKAFEKINSRNFSSFGTKKILFISTVQFTLKLINAERVSRILSGFFDVMIRSTAEDFLKKKPYINKFLIAAMGSFGSGEMTFASDIDLVFIIDGLNEYPESQKDFQSLLLKLKEKCRPFDVDCRLRPEGKSSILVWDLESYKTYIARRARIWELQSFCKLSFVAGNKKLFGSLSRAVNSRIKIEDESVIKNEMTEMRKKLYSLNISSGLNTFNLKKDKGGVKDIEFIFEYLILSGKLPFGRLKGKSVDKILTAFGAAPEYKKDAEELKNNFFFLKEIEMTIQTVFNSSSPSLPSSEEKLFTVAERTGFESAGHLRRKLAEVLNSGNSLFIKYLAKS